MLYRRESNSIISCENFLPKPFVDKLYIDLLNAQSRFGVSNWATNEIDDSKEFFSHYCGGFDFWITEPEQTKGVEEIAKLKNWFFHQGLFRFAESERMSNYSVLTRKCKHHIHVVAYNNGGYYNWHKDMTNGNIFTFNLILNKGTEKLKGGDMLFMDDGERVQISNQNNLMVVFPTHVDHAITPIVSENNKDVAFAEQRFSIQFWVHFDVQ
tara:strand:+ start:750 stop:1382 length:633 start_codon:yes stop_codon:yes gene_type:complete